MNNKRRIAFVSVRYGLDINGGAELHCRMLAERLALRHDVEVLTTCVKDYVKGSNEYPAGEESMNGVLVRRFAATPPDHAGERRWLEMAKPARRLRMRLYQAGLLRAVSAFAGTWTWKLKEDVEAQKCTVFYSADLLRYLSEHRDSYDAFIVFSSNFPLFYFSAMAVGDKTLAVPLLHKMKASFRVSLDQAFSRIRYVGFNTDAEMKLGKDIFGTAIRDCGIIGTGIGLTAPAPWDEVKRKYSLPDRYALFIGRIDTDKTGRMAEYYSSYRKRYGNDALPLVVMGKTYEQEAAAEGMIYTGFVSEEDKRAMLLHARVLINPSEYESLSLVLLEAMHDRVPALVNGRCEVFRKHREKSGRAVQCYRGARDFISKLHKIDTDEAERLMMQEKGERYMKENYSWEIIMDRLEKALDKVSAAESK